ncbi:glycoside hydrolase family 2 protein [Granulicella tundricola]|uniref:Glycoside hydrolase family 2 sugar binding protein n=1 Tax=Granulicella tundricola (strain ATCC BAA-1859 / DSM 23138 / MP5ACTX9) TaxID=1198114 RepID=E8X3Q5_GRATM|nr:glycoside hydrolase family 2 [Granulicella tundricola]ADW69333.1 glycoside hydrolase family 2 sugar binding protein [Granulicella tundricola MP5ACTX9]
MPSQYCQLPIATRRISFSKLHALFLCLLLQGMAASAQQPQEISAWEMQDVAKVPATGDAVSLPNFKTASWYKATVPGTVLTTLVDNHVYPEPLYGENMRAIPESLNKTSYWYRTSFTIPSAYKGHTTWLHFAGINYSAQVWVNGHSIGSIKGAFIRGDFDISAAVKPGTKAVLAVLISPQPHPGIPHEHTIADGVGKNGGDTALDGATFLSTIGWDWIPAIRDRDTGIWLPVTLSSTGPLVIDDPAIRSDLAASHATADLSISGAVTNSSAKTVDGTLTGTITEVGDDASPKTITFTRKISVEGGKSLPLALDPAAIPELHINAPRLWWPNGYGKANLYRLSLNLRTSGGTSDVWSGNFGIRTIQYQVAGSENLTLSVNGVPVMARGGNWGLDEAMKRVPKARLDAQFHMHALAHLNIIRNWVGQSTSPDFYEMADKYGILLWDEFFQPNPGDGPNVADIPTYLKNVTDKVTRYRNHPSIAVWCARNEGYPPKELDDTLRVLMAKLDPTRLYQSNSADGHGVSSHGPYYWRSPRYFYALNESFKTETGSVSIPTIESIQGMMPQKDWETINDDWAQHDLAKGAQRGDQYPSLLAKRYGPIRNLADFTRKGQLANYEAFRAMYEGRNAQMFTATTGVITWMSHPAQPSFVWQLYHYDLEPNASLYGAQKASEHIHVQLNEANFGVEVVNNTPEPLSGYQIRSSIYALDGTLSAQQLHPVENAPGVHTTKIFQLVANPSISAVYFVKLDLLDATGNQVSTNFYWQNVDQDDFTSLGRMPPVTLEASATSTLAKDKTMLKVVLHNPTNHVALMTHLQLHREGSEARVLPVFYSENYISLAPQETRELLIDVATADLHGTAPILAVDGFNIHVKSSGGPIRIMNNENADPMHWPASNLVGK